MKRLRRSLLLLAGVIGLAANSFASDSSYPVNVSGYETDGELEATHDLGCIEFSPISNTFSPADLYKAVGACIKTGKYDEGAKLFALAGSYGLFDTLRVTDISAHQSVTALQIKLFVALPPAQKTAFKESVARAFGTAEGLAVSCKEIVRVGPPNYFPAYMINHGMGAFAKISPAGNGLATDFSVPGAWKQALEGYLHCPSSV